jgi:alpha-galactosidase
MIQLNFAGDFSFEIEAGPTGKKLADGRVLLVDEAVGSPQPHWRLMKHSGDGMVTTPLGLAQRETLEAVARVNGQAGAKADLQARPYRVRLTMDRYDPWKDAVILQLNIHNAGDMPLAFRELSFPELTLDPAFAHNLWSMQGAAVHWGQDFAFPLTKGFQRDNYLGHIQHGEGGGIPMLDFWNGESGLALAHIEPTQEPWYMPVDWGKRVLRASFSDRRPYTLNPGGTYTSPRILITLHQGDFFEPLALYREIMAIQGLKATDPNPQDYAPAWCSWGYEFDVRPSEVTGVLPELKPLGIRWLTLDDRWFDHYGDWNPRSDTFPGGLTDLFRIVEEIHRAGGYAQVWWYPLCAEDGIGGWDGYEYGASAILKEHPDWLVLNQDGSIARNNRGLAMLCPGVEAVQEYTLDLVRKFVAEWGFDGHKLDNIYCMPPCYNPAHHHARPEEAVESFAWLYRQIFEITRELRPDSVTQICPCGTPITHTLMPATDQTVTADPTSSAQIRQRIKFYKALMGPQAAVFADHVELSDGEVDFASCLGPGGVLSTKFIWPPDEQVERRLREQYFPLTPKKEVTWQKWFQLAAEHSLADGEYLNLYDLAFDTPEAHVIRKGKILYFAFFTSRMEEAFRGNIVLRGLAGKRYRARDYINGHDLGMIQGPLAELEVEFTGSLLLQATEEE